MKKHLLAGLKKSWSEIGYFGLGMVTPWIVYDALRGFPTTAHAVVAACFYTFWLTVGFIGFRDGFWGSYEEARRDAAKKEAILDAVFTPLDEKNS